MRRDAAALWALTRQPGIGPAKALTIVSDPDAARFDGDIEQLVEQHPLPDVAGARPVGHFDDEFPDLLRHIPAPPALLWLSGRLPDQAGLAVVGTRRPTRWGRAVAARAAHAVPDGVPIISGLAAGIDTAAHQAALDAGQPTVAVLGGGIDRPTPAANVDLAAAIVDAGGALLSEQPPGTEPSGPTLVARNRLQSGLSSVVLPAQFVIPSGTAHTVRFAIAQQRTLLTARPTGSHAQHRMCAGNLALCDPAGIDPTVLSATGRDAAAIAGRLPCADTVVEEGDELDEALQALFG